MGKAAPQICDNMRQYGRGHASCRSPVAYLHRCSAPPLALHCTTVPFLSHGIFCSLAVVILGLVAVCVKMRGDAVSFWSPASAHAAHQQSRNLHYHPLRKHYLRSSARSAVRGVNAVGSLGRPMLQLCLEARPFWSWPQMIQTVSSRVHV